MAKGGDQKPMIPCWARASAEYGEGGAVRQRAGVSLPSPRPQGWTRLGVWGQRSQKVQAPISLGQDLPDALRVAAESFPPLSPCWDSGCHW